MTLRRRAVRIAGHATSVSIEDAFWEEIKRAAAEDGTSIARLIEAVDRGRLADAAPGETPANLSSALRLYVLARVKARRRD
ncbi:MAG: ribbon-helix-helix domain-containing protein [Alphaproteobacteria bacterium]|nr:ribbon-helix-helix domain-containing protein [Alphaproteobacteria bacterium]